ncbi:hypothetical protein ACFQ10_46025 [Streptomyces indonesiensis]
MKHTATRALDGLRRLAGMATTLLVTSFLVFSSLYLAPGDPASFLVRGRSASPRELAEIRHQYGFDQPFLVRYGHWLDQVLHGDFGRSYVFHQDVSSVIWSRLQPRCCWSGCRHCSSRWWASRRAWSARCAAAHGPTPRWCFW